MNGFIIIGFVDRARLPGDGAVFAKIPRKENIAGTCPEGVGDLSGDVGL